MKTDEPPLFGRDLLQHIRIDRSHVDRLASSTASTQRRLDKLLERHSVVFGEDRGRFRHCKGRLHLVGGAKPRFFKARPLPYTLRDKVATEQVRLNNQLKVNQCPLPRVNDVFASLAGGQRFIYRPLPSLPST